MNKLFFAVALLFLVSDGWAKPGKVFFANGRWLKGDIREQKDSNGNEVVVINLESGSITHPRHDIKNIIYSGKSSDPSAPFQKALERTKSKSPVALRPAALYDPYIRLVSSRHQLDPELVRAVIKQESNFVRTSVSKKGAQGLMQLMPQTAKNLGVQDAFDPWENIQGGTRYLRMLLEDFGWDLKKALAAYNAGPGAVRRYGTIPPYPETQGYVRNIMRHYQDRTENRLYAFEDRAGGLVITDLPFLR